MILSFSGPDNSGKSTQIELLRLTAVKNGLSTKVVWSRGGYTPLFSLLKLVILFVSIKKSKNRGDKIRRSQYVRGSSYLGSIWYFFAIVDLMLVWGLYVRVLSRFYDLVILDRFIYDTDIDFVGFYKTHDFSKGILWRLLRWVLPDPNLKFVLAVDIDTARVRSRTKQEPFPDSANNMREKILMYSQDFFFDDDIVRLDSAESIQEVSKKTHAAVFG